MALQLKRLAVLVVATAAAFAIIPAHAAAKKGLNAGTKMSSENHPDAASVESMRTADLLLRYGYTNKDPLALIAGAKIMKAAGGIDAVAERISGKPGAAKDKPDIMTVEAALARARELAVGRADIIGLADDVAKSGGRGAVGGPKITRTVVNTRAIDNFRVKFRGEEPARIVVSGDGDSDLDLFVYDENGNQVCADTDSTDDMACSFTPAWTGTFTVRVKNLGLANRYVLMTN